MTIQQIDEQLKGIRAMVGSMIESGGKWPEVKSLVNEAQVLHAIRRDLIEKEKNKQDSYQYVMEQVERTIHG